MNRRFVGIFVLCLTICFVGAALAVETKPEVKKEEQKPVIGELKNPADSKALKYRLLGPAWGGRATRASGIAGDGSIYYVATAGGGIWKSTDAGKTWASIFDDQPVSSIGSLAVAPSDPNVIYAGSGEANIRGNVAAGNGIYKSIDAGKTWNHVWVQEGQIGTMVVHPKNPDIAFAAVLGHAFGPNKERGVYKTSDGGKTWRAVLQKDENTGASDVAIDPSNPNILFAGLWQARRSPWSLTSGGPGEGLYTSRDGGETWKQLKGNGLPEGTMGKIGVAVAPSDSQRVYALIEAEEGGLFRSDDGGENWTRVNAGRVVRQRAWYYSTLTVNPQNPNEVWCPQVPMLKSTDGGTTFNIVKVPHGDNHDLWIDPKNPQRMIAANDGGVALSNDGGNSWVWPPIPIGQFYHVSVDSRVPFHVAGAQQDIGTAQGPSNSLSSGGIRNSDWHTVGGGEAGWVVSDPSDPNIVYAGEYLGYISRYDNRTGEERAISIYPEDGSGHGAEDLKYRFQWTAPIAVSPHNPKVVYHGANVIFRTEDGGQTWNPISPDLTRNDKSKQKWTGGPITGDNTGIEFYDTVFVIAESPAQKDLIWAGTDDGLVQITKDGGKQWENVTKGMSGLPEWATIRMIEPSRQAAGTAYVVADAHRLDNTRPYIYKTTDFGKTWTSLASNLPSGIYLHSVREDPVDPGILYLGTERGVVFSLNGGKNWEALKLNMPTVAVHDLIVKNDSLVVATMGRSLWTFDHLAMLRRFAKLDKNSPAQILGASDIVRWGLHSSRSDTWSAENPPMATVYYWLKTAPKGDITIDVLDDQNHVVKTLSSKPKPAIGYSDDPKGEEEAAKKAALPKDAGLQAAAWDPNYDGVEMIQGAKEDWGDPSYGPYLLPGTYTLRLNADGKISTTTVKVSQDPRSKISDSDLKEQLRFLNEIGSDINSITNIVRRIRTMRDQIKQRNALLQGKEQYKDAIDAGEAVIKKLDMFEEQLQNPEAEVSYDILGGRKGGAKLYSRLSATYGFVRDNDGLPTQGTRDLYRQQKTELDAVVQKFNDFVASDIAALNKSARDRNLPIILTE